MPKASMTIKLSPELKARLMTEAAKEGVDLSVYVRDHLEEILKGEAVGISIAEPTYRSARPYQPPKVDPLDDYVVTLKKMAVAKMFQNLATSSIMSPEQQLQQFGQAPKWVQQKPPEQKEQFSTKDMMDRITILRMIEGMERKESDPAIKEMMRELKDAQLKLLDKPKASPRSDIKQRLDELKEYAMTMRIFGSDKEAKQAETLLRQEIGGIRKELHDAEILAVRRESDWKEQNLQRQINEIKNAPSQFDQITR